MARNSNATSNNQAPVSETTVFEHANQTATKELILNAIRMGTSDAIGYSLQENSVDLRTNKLKVQVAISIGNGQSLSEVSVLPVTVAKSFDNENCLQVLHLPVIQLLALASNGIFELFNTNPKNSEQFSSLCQALLNGFAYPSSYTQSMKKDPFVWAKFVGELNLMAKERVLSDEQIGQYEAAKKRVPLLPALIAFLTRAYDSPAWAWLRALMDEAGYTVVEDMDSELEDLLKG